MRMNFQTITTQLAAKLCRVTTKTSTVLPSLFLAAFCSVTAQAQSPDNTSGSGEGIRVRTSPGHTPIRVKANDSVKAIETKPASEVVAAPAILNRPAMSLPAVTAAAAPPMVPQYAMPPARPLPTSVNIAAEFGMRQNASANRVEQAGFTNSDNDPSITPAVMKEQGVGFGATAQIPAPPTLQVSNSGNSHIRNNTSVTATPQATVKASPVSTGGTVVAASDPMKIVPSKGDRLISTQVGEPVIVSSQGMPLGAGAYGTPYAAPMVDPYAMDGGYYPMNPGQRLAPMNGGAYSDPHHGRGVMPPVGVDPASLGSCGPENCRLFYASVEALYWKQNEDQSLGLVAGRRLEDFDYEFASRITVGQMMNCSQGVEAVYTGPFKFTRARDVVGTNLNSRVTSVVPGFLANLDTFNNATRQSESLETKLNSFELNRRRFSSDLFSTTLGLRFVSYDERFRYVSVAADQAGVGLFQNDLQNFLIGAQVGANMYRPISQRLSFGGWGKAGVFANFDESRTFLSNRGTVLADTQRNDVDFAGLLQGNVGLRYRILPRFDITAGYEALFIPGVATASQQRQFPLTVDSGNDVRADDSVFFHGANVGLEFSY